MARPQVVEIYLHSHNTPSWRGTQLKDGAQGELTLCEENVMKHIFVCIKYLTPEFYKPQQTIHLSSNLKVS